MLHLKSTKKVWPKALRMKLFAKKWPLYPIRDSFGCQYILELISEDSKLLRWGCWWLNVTGIIDLALNPLPTGHRLVRRSQSLSTYKLMVSVTAPSPPSPPTLRHSMGNSRRAAGRASSDATVPSVKHPRIISAGRRFLNDFLLYKNWPKQFENPTKRWSYIFQLFWYQTRYNSAYMY